MSSTWSLLAAAELVPALEAKEVAAALVDC
jgi:hypothetical protein